MPSLPVCNFPPKTNSYGNLEPSFQVSRRVSILNDYDYHYDYDYSRQRSVTKAVSFADKRYRFGYAMLTTSLQPFTKTKSTIFTTI